MKPLKSNNFKGFTLLELMVVISIIGVLASIAIPQYLSYRGRARAVNCQANRYHIEMTERVYFVDNGVPGLKIDDLYKCPCGGEYVWLVSDPKDTAYPKVGCSIHYAQLPATPGEDALFSSGFDDMDGLTPLRGTWEIKNGDLVPAGRGERRLAFGDKTWTDYEMSVNATLSGGQGYGIYYRADGERNITGYCFQYDPGYGRGEFLVRKVVNGRETRPIQRVRIPDGFPVYNTSHEISVAVEDDHHVIKVDGEKIFSFDDDSFTSGSAGFRSWGKSEVSFQNVNVAEID